MAITYEKDEEERLRKTFALLKLLDMSYRHRNIACNTLEEELSKQDSGLLLDTRTYDKYQIIIKETQRQYQRYCTIVKPFFEIMESALMAKDDS